VLPISISLDLRLGKWLLPSSIVFGKLVIMEKKIGNHRVVYLYVGLFLAVLIAGGCAHYPANPFLKEFSPGQGYRMKNISQAERSDRLIVILTFSGGGTRAAALAYGVLEELAKAEFSAEGRNRYLLDEVDVISSVSGGSFTAAYYGLFGRRIFEDFESRFLKKNIQEELFYQTLKPSNGFRLMSGKFARGDLAAEYYDQYIFGGGTFGEIIALGGPLILVNATDIALGTYFTFSQETFDILCSDVSRLPLSRAVAASSSVPVILSPITLYNYAGSCNYEAPRWVKRALEQPALSRRRFQKAAHLESYMDSQKRPYIHLIDGGISDNLGLRAVIDWLIAPGEMWQALQYLGWENTRKVVFIIVNAEQGTDFHLDYLEKTVSSGSVLKSTTNIPIIRYNFETVELLKGNFKNWTEEIRSRRCAAANPSGGTAPAYSEADPCADIQFYLVEVDFEAVPDKSERSYLMRLPTSFNLPPEDVDRLRAAAHQVLTLSPEFQRLLRDLKGGP
jgi:NTE family protein